jgi:glycosyltransferase involved in cell wall biosynthesis
VLVEAMGSGLPTVATNIFEIRSFVEHGKHSFLVPPNSRSGLSKAMGQLFENQEERHRLAKAGRNLAESLSSDVMVEQYENLYAEIAKS